MKKVLLFFTILFLSLSGYAKQHPDDHYKDYFQKVLKGENAVIPEKRIKLRRLDAYRQTVWNSWKEANTWDNEQVWPELDSLKAQSTGMWKLPTELEPQAKMPFYWGYKGNLPENGYPMFLYLHGSGPKEHEWSTSHQLAQIFDDAPCIYFIPQIPNEGPWYRWWQKSKQYAWDRLFRKALLRKDIDPNRLYVFGISEGGYGSQRLASFYADYWAAAGPMAGGEPLKNAPAENLSNIGFSLLTGAQDYGFYRNILTAYTQQALDSLQDLYPSQFPHHIELIPERGHHIDYRPTTPWLSRFTRNPWPKHFMWEDFEMDGLHRKGFYNLYIQQRPCDSLRTRYDMDIEENVVRISVHHIIYQTTETDSIYGIAMKFGRKYVPAENGKLTLFLNEHLVDLKRPVQVFLNNRKVFSGMVPLNIKNLIRSTSVFNDPERMFPAAVEIKY